MILYVSERVSQVVFALSSIDWRGLEWEVALIAATATVLNTVLAVIVISHYRLAVKKLEASQEKDKLLAETALSNDDRYFVIIDRFCELTQITHTKVGDVSASLQGLGEAIHLLVDETEKVGGDADVSFQELKDDVVGIKELLTVLEEHNDDDEGEK